jgi:phosphoglycerate dehydrogenase-like enzyme
VEELLHPALVESPVVVTKISGANAVPVAEHCIGLMFALARRLPHWAEGQGEGRWLPREHSEMRDISGSTLGIVGLGAIGSQLARRAKALGMRVLATKRRIYLKPDYVDELIPREELPRLIAQADFLSINCPETPETRGMMGEEELRIMKPTAYLINTARGGIVRQEALLRALKEGWIAGAALDVTTPEPLPAESELWSLPNIIIHPHTAGASPTVDDAKVSLFCENVRRYIQGQPLLNVVDKHLGY